MKAVLLAAVLCVMVFSAQASQERFNRWANEKGLLALENIPANWTNCGSDSDIFRVSSVELDRAPRRGVNVTVFVNGTMTVAQSIAGFHINCKVNNIPIWSQDIDQPADVSAGSQYTATYGSFFPSFTPPGKFQVDISVFNTDNQTLSCSELIFTL
eukprot:TRINITY_DN1597_c0_g1_i4.p1 TRINITY_DN1597_c0_g1~~TRINITY_DN1597_c0_g1_i4.p1  ORF type:complete len:156 (-),score=31.75 TRINITY_DN1597_c0_g1_i4:46-513(-)